MNVQPITWFSDNYTDTLDICTEYRDKGVVGMDIAGDEGMAVTKDGDGEMTRSEILERALTRALQRV